jgi:hypothetical protein
VDKSELEIKHLMEHPVFLGHDANAKIIRAQLFFLSVTTIFLTNSSIKVSSGSTVLGIGLEGLTTAHILKVLLFLIAYQIIHFSWASVESFYEWRARLTALDTGGWGGGGVQISSEDIDTLYAYITDIVNHDLKELGKLAAKTQPENTSQHNQEVEKILTRITETLTHHRTSDALWRFDNWFKLFCKIQNIRWFFLELFTPIALGFIAIYFIIVNGALFC